MSIRDDLTINWTVSPRIIEVTNLSIPLTIQDLYDTLRSKAALGEAMDDAEIIDGSGKDDLGGGVLVGLTIKFLNAKVKFVAQGSPTVCTISGGNLIAVDGNGDSMSPIEPSTNVSVVIAQSTSASLIEGSGVDPSTIADAIWDESIAEHISGATFGAKNQKVVPSEDTQDYKADVSGLALEETAQSIKTKTENLPDHPADETSVQTVLERIGIPTSPDIAGDLDEISSKVELVKAKTDTIEWVDVTLIKQIEQGRWKIENNQMIFYEANNVTEVARFDLFDANGEPAMKNVMERKRV